MTHITVRYVLSGCATSLAAQPERPVPLGYLLTVNKHGRQLPAGHSGHGDRELLPFIRDSAEFSDSPADSILTSDSVHTICSGSASHECTEWPSSLECRLYVTKHDSTSVEQYSNPKCRSRLTVTIAYGSDQTTR
jgi:hypothetical protein